jgi:hypothetical protein
MELGNSTLIGTIPDSVGALQRMEFIDLASQGIHGAIPETLFSLPKLRVVALDYNFITFGTISL